MSLKKATVENAKGLHICCTNGDSHATIMTVQCPKTFNLSLNAELDGGDGGVCRLRQTKSGPVARLE